MNLNCLICLRKRKHYSWYISSSLEYTESYTCYLDYTKTFQFFSISAFLRETEEKNYSPDEVSEYDDWGFDRDLLEKKKINPIILLSIESCKKCVYICFTQLAPACSNSKMETLEQIKKICSKLTIKIPERTQSIALSGVFTAGNYMF